MRFQLKSLFASLTCLCVLLSLNAIPWHGHSEIHFYDYPDTFKLKVESYGWPRSFFNEYSAYDLPPNLPGDLTVEDIEDPIRPNRALRLRVFDNLIVIGLISLALFICVEISFRYWFNSTEESEHAK